MCARNFSRHDFKIRPSIVDVYWSSSDLGLAVGMADLGLRMTFLSSEVGQGTYQDFAIPFNGRPRG